MFWSGRSKWGSVWVEPHRWVRQHSVQAVERRERKCRPSSTMDAQWGGGFWLEGRGKWVHNPPTPSDRVICHRFITSREHHQDWPAVRWLWVTADVEHLKAAPLLWWHKWEGRPKGWGPLLITRRWSISMAGSWWEGFFSLLSSTPRPLLTGRNGRQAEC